MCGCDSAAIRARLSLEARLQIRIKSERKVPRQNFDRNVAPQARVVSAVNLAHAACAEQRDNFIRPEFASRCEPHAFARHYSPTDKRFSFETAQKQPHSGLDSSHPGDDSRMVARLDRKRLGQDTLAWKWISIRGVFDKQTRRKPLVFAADAVRYGI